MDDHSKSEELGGFHIEFGCQYLLDDVAEDRWPAHSEKAVF
jgi:hypothetical protein